MASSFQRYQSGIQPVTGMSEAGANIGRAYQQGIASFGDSIAKGLQQYNENTAKGQILDQEAQALGQQIISFQQMFADPQTGQINPEYAQFAQTLQPHIEQLSKVPSMSLTQKMGAVTGVKAAFSNIGQNLTAFEMTKKARLQQDMAKAGMLVKEYDEATVPTAIIPSGKMPYFYNKSYTENEAEVIRLANEAKAKGANVDLPSVLENWRKGIKANAMSRTDIPPQIKEGLIKQIDAGESYTANEMTDESGVTDYAKEAELYEKSQTSVKDQLAPPKVEPSKSKTANAPSSEAISKYNEQRKGYETAIESLTKNLNRTQTLSDSEFNSLAAEKAKSTGSRYTAVSALEEEGWSKGKDASGNQVWTNNKVKDQPTAQALDFYKGKLAELDASMPKPATEKTTKSGVAGVDVEKTKTELDSINKEITKLNEAIERGDDIALSGKRQAGNYFMRKMGDASEWLGGKMIKQALVNSNINLNDPEAVRREIDRLGNTGFGTLELFGRSYINALQTNPLYDAFSGRDITNKQEKLIEAEIQRALQDPEKGQFALKLAKATGDTEGQKIALQAYKTELENRLLTGKVNAKPTDISKAQQTQATQQAQATQQEQAPYALTNQNAFNLGTTTAKIATTLDSKRNDMKQFFMNKYGYVPASFEESFKAIYPEASFKTMETPYGAFMYDGKEWKQIQIQQPKVMSNKEIAENKAVTFGKDMGDGNLDFQELVPNSGVFVRGIYAGSPTEASRFRTQMLEASNARKAVGRLIEINEMAGESMPWNAKLWGEAKALLPQIKAGLRTDIIGVGTVSNYEQQLIEEVVADPTKFWSLESSDRAKLTVIMEKISNRLVQEPANFGLEVKVAGKTNAERERELRMKSVGAGKSKLELDFEARGGKKGVALDWNKANKIPDALK